MQLVHKNIKYFQLFRIFFTVRFYYPVFTVLALDYGLSLEQFALLNSVWALTIVFLEVPSGALADTIGRKNLLIAAGVFMFIEMLLLLIVPIENISLLFWVFVLNRVLSGAAEAAASGADEAIAYESLRGKDVETQWSKILSKTMQYRSIAMVGAMVIGAFVFDSVFLNKTFKLLGSDLVLSQQQTMRFPIFLCLISSIVVFYAAISMEELKGAEDQGPDDESADQKILTKYIQVFKTGFRAMGTQALMAVIVLGFFIDGFLRTFITLNSEYFRYLKLPDVLFGVIGGALALGGFFIPYVATRFFEKKGIISSYLKIAAMGATSLFLISVSSGFWGVGAVFLLAFSMFLLNYVASVHINASTGNKIRATVLSFKGLAFNLSYGGISLLYGFLLKYLKNNQNSSDSFELSLKYLPIAFVLCFTAALIFVMVKKRNCAKTVLRSQQ